MRMVHILLGKANPETLNGVNKVVHWMATSQLHLGHKVEVWGLSSSMNLPPHSRQYALRIFPATRLRVTLGQEIKTALSRLEPDTWVHFHSVFIPEFPAIARLLKKRGFRYGITPHGGYDPGRFKKNLWQKRLYVALREAPYLRDASWIQAIGASEIPDILRLAPQALVVLIPNCQEQLTARPSAAPIDAQHPVIGYCGRLARQHKGLDFLIDGFANYKAKGGSGELWLIGDGEDRAALERQAARSGATPHLRFLGAKHGEEKLNLLASLDVFIHPSRWDVLPTACLEAAALGRPLVVSRETNLANDVQRNKAGLVLGETSAAGVLRALQCIQQLYENHQLRQMGECARLLVEKEFRWEQNARSFVAAIATCGGANSLRHTARVAPTPIIPSDD
jgi:glycosyltransferase involved in cell wall biosynthesis